MGGQNVTTVRISNFRVSIDEREALETLVCVRLKIGRQQQNMRIVRKALDARREGKICFVYTVETEIAGASSKWRERWLADRNVSLVVPQVACEPVAGSQKLAERPVVIGFGPAGMFAALMLARYGYKPLVLERGPDVEERQLAVQRFWEQGILDEAANVQFGEGGAGTFSDGKLTTRVHDPLMNEVLAALVAAGAPPEIKYWYKPHVGTDRLREVVKNIRQQIRQLGGEVRFGQQVTDLRIESGVLTGLMVNGEQRIDCSVALLGIGHSARDTYQQLQRLGVAMEAKPSGERME